MVNSKMGTETSENGINSPNESSTSLELQKGDRKPLSNKLKYITAAVIFYGNLTFGCGFNTYGTALTSLQTKYDVDDATISTVFTILTCGNLVGGLSGGILYNYVNRQLAVITIFTGMAAVMFLTPHCPTLTTFFISAAVMGLCCGAYDAAQVVWMMEMMQAACPPYVQAQHFFFAVGTSLNSVIMAPYLLHDDDEEGDGTTTTVKADDTDNLSRLFIPYTIIGAMVGCTAVAQLFLFIFLRYRPPPPEILAETENTKNELEGELENKNEITGLRIGKWSLPKLRMVVLATIFLGAYQGMEVCTFEFFSKFGQNSNLNLSEKRAAYTLTGMTAAFAVCRAIGIVAAVKIKPQLILCGNLVLVAIANVLLIGWASNSLPVLWTCSIIFGIGFSTMYPAFCSYVERYLRFTNFIGALMIVCGAGLAALYPLIIGRFIEEHPVVLSYTAFFSLAMILFSFGTLSYLTYKNKTRY